MSHQSLRIVDSKTGTSAQVCASLGFNCHSFVPVVDGRPTEVLWTASDFLAGTARPSGSGIPLLFPFAGRIGHQRFDYHGRAYQLASDDRRGNAIHGFVLDRPWTVVQHEADQVVGRFQASQVDPSILEQWPSDFVLEVRYAVLGARLASHIRIENPGPGPLPCWLGTHPYFRVPLGAEPAAQSCRVQVPAAARWELVEMLPHGRRLRVEGNFDLRAGLPFSQTQLDDVYTEVAASNGRVETSVIDPVNQRRLCLSFSEAFGEVVVYNPPHREAICIEPYTSVPDAFALAKRGEATGLRELAPGETWELEIDLELAAL